MNWIVHMYLWVYVCHERKTKTEKVTVGFRFKKKGWGKKGISKSKRVRERREHKQKNMAETKKKTQWGGKDLFECVRFTKKKKKKKTKEIEMNFMSVEREREGKDGRKSRTWDFLEVQWKVK